MPTAIDGVARCARYAFGPNKLHLCGPDANREVLAYVQEGASDAGLSRILTGFQTLYPYLQNIAQANAIRDPFDPRVVEAYWIGNELLEGIAPRVFYHHLADTLRMKARMGNRAFDQMVGKLPKGARMHHSFHVFNAYKRTGNDATLHTLESMDACRVSWGKVVSVNGPKITVLRRPLTMTGHALSLGAEEKTFVLRKLEDVADFDELQPGQWLTMHWGQPCEIVDDRSVPSLERYTLQSIALANTTL